ncbi:energy transducer TonB, partial [Escherichia coli]|uniref:energy transducer TonB family protein n=2 Tax=Pseudomonadota TaxID=1224 RepID=UPI001931988E
QVDPIPETTAPKSHPAPPASSVSSDQPVSWEAKLLAHLERHRRYPATSRARRDQGVAHVRFRMNRAGRVLEVALIRSSGIPELDRAALATIRRAQPLPAIPDDRPDPLDLSVPVEFFLR